MLLLDETAHSTALHMINLLEKTRHSFEVLVGKKPSMDLDLQPKTKPVFAQCKFAIVRSSKLEGAAANQVCTYILSAKAVTDT